MRLITETMKCDKCKKYFMWKVWEGRRPVAGQDLLCDNCRRGQEGDLKWEEIPKGEESKGLKSEWLRGFIQGVVTGLLAGVGYILWELIGRG